MKITVCIKQVPATNDIRMDPVTNTIIRDSAEAVLNPFDAYAIEEAVRIKEKTCAHIDVITMGIPSAKDVLKTALALGADEGYLMTDHGFAGSDTLATAWALSLGIKHCRMSDLIICGKQATDGDTAQVGPSLACALNISCITNVSRIEKLTDSCIRCMRITDDGYEEVEAELPAVITVVKEINMPRLPSIKGMKRAAAIDIHVLSLADVCGDESRLGLKGSPTQVRKTFVPQRCISTVMIKGTAREQAEQIGRLLAERM